MTYLAIALLAVAAVLAVFANHRYHWAAGWWYDWQHARHLATEAPEPELVFVDPYGSMIWEAERTIYPLPWPRQEGDWLPAPAWPNPLDWREQTAADLAPETLDSDVQPDPYLDAIAAEYGSEYEPADFQPGGPEGARDVGQSPARLEADSGPGDLSSLDPGPDWLDGQLAVLYEWVRAQYAAAAA